MHGLLRTVFNNLVTVVLNYRIAQQIEANLVDRIPHFRRVLTFDIKLDGFADPDICSGSVAEANHGLAHGRSLWIEDIFFG